ncbi:unnamed protein product [Parnassius apollo]|uniref:(apollo) hypothetical protein n=1 Tax=Parnassius apollo TaxID=110799 RepID=A0A8S3WTH3_PARAO|nr:unnamed protein product [Parnassius apollo]
MRSKIFDDAELERLRREAIPSSNELATAGDAAPQATDQLPRVEAAMDLPVVVDSDDDEMVSHELEQRKKLEYTGRGDFGNAHHASRKSTATSPHTPKQAKSGCREGS